MTDRLSLEDLAAFDYELPSERIAQLPCEQRDAARLFVLSRATGEVTHSRVRELTDFLRPGDLLVVNSTRVLPARLRGKKATGGNVEALLLGDAEADDSKEALNRSLRRFRALVRCSGRVRVGQKFRFGPETSSVFAEVQARFDKGEVILAFESAISPFDVGEMPLPPYIRRNAPRDVDTRRYQTVFAKSDGSVAAPTAGLHLTPNLFDALRQRGVGRAEVTLHVGPGTFRPVGSEQLAQGKLHREAFELPEETAEKIRETRQRGGRVVAVGTTTTRVLETRATEGGLVQSGRGDTEIFIYPGVPFRVVDVLLTNFHLPKSSLLLLVAAFAGRERILDAYAKAIREEYRFYSYGDAMLIE